MILVDSGVWIDYFNGIVYPEIDKLDETLDLEEVVIEDLILTEVLQGFRKDSDYKTAKNI